MIRAEAAWSREDGGAVFVFTDGEVHPNGQTWQMEPLTILEAHILVDEVLKAIKRAGEWEETKGEG